MMDLLKKLFGGNNVLQQRRGVALKSALERYPVNAPPHLGWGCDLNDEQINANLAFVLETEQMRIAAISALLKNFRIDVSPLLNPNIDPLATCDAIDLWLINELPERDDLPGQPSVNSPSDMFIASNRSGPHILFSMIGDLGLLVYNAIRLHDPRFNWANDLDTTTRSTRSSRRPCMIKARQDDFDSVIFDHELIMLSIVYEKRTTIPIYKTKDDLEGVMLKEFR